MPCISLILSIAVSRWLATCESSFLIFGVVAKSAVGIFFGGNVDDDEGDGGGCLNGEGERNAVVVGFFWGV